MGNYKTAQICLNGHIITRSYSSKFQKFCTKCGSEAITNCPNCGSILRGRYEVPGVLDLTADNSPAPSYCYSCGKPYPWTESALEVARLLILEDENLNDTEKEQFSDSLPDLLTESPTPKTKLAIVRFKKYIGKAATYTVEGIRDIFVDVASEAIKKSLGL
jgi:hypothetical protein